MGLFEDMADDIFESDIGTDADYYFADGRMKTVRVVEEREGQDIDGLLARAHVEALVLRVRVSEVESPAKDETIDYGGKVRRIKSDPKLHRRGTQWQLEMAPE